MKKSIFAPWLIRFYEWYFSVRGSYQPRQENFCRFGRTVFLWAPLYWFFCRRFALGMRPWMPVVLAAYIPLLIVAPIMMIVITFAAVWFGFLMLPSRTLRRIKNFLDAGVAGRVHRWHVLSVAFFATVSYVFPEAVLVSVAFVAGVAAAIAVIVAGVAGLVELHRFLRRFIHISVSIRIPRPRVRLPAVSVPAPIRSTAANFGGILSTAWHFLVVLKHKTICPWVSFSEGRVEFVFAPEPIKE